MYQITVISSRSTTDVVFYPQHDSVKTIIQTYRDSGDLVTEDLSISDDGLSRTYTATWISKEKYLEFIDNEVVTAERLNRKMYNQNNNIVMALAEAKEI